jgi:hypothetical protein
LVRRAVSSGTLLIRATCLTNNPVKAINDAAKP